MPNMCENMTTLGIFIDGGFAQYNVAPEEALHEIPSEMPPERAVFAEPLSCVVNAVDKLKPQPGESAVILGAGPIGLLFIQMLVATGVKPLIASEPVEFRRKVAWESGAQVVVDPQKENLRERVMELTNRGVDMAVDAVGVLFEDAVKLVRPGGRVMIFGQNETFTAQFKPYYITRYEKRILGSFIAKFTFPKAIKLLESDLLQTDKLVTHQLKLEEFSKGLELMRKGEAIKVILKP
jgi:threonine dehydrogenase-like Zn-dependent dehydrogenase